MENNEISNIEKTEEKEQNNDVIQQSTSLDQQSDSKQNLTNEQKLEYISQLIQKAEQNLEEKGISKTLVRKDDSLK